MCARELIFLIGAVYVFAAVLALDIYIAELMVESNVTLEAETVLSALNKTSDLQVTDKNGAEHTVTLTSNELIAECLIFGADTSCNCSDQFTWSNEVCDKSGCCRDTACTKNVSSIVPLCVPESRVRINGSVILSKSSWDSSKTTELKNEFEGLNAFEYLNVTGQRMSDSIADFEVAVNVKLDTSKLQTIVTSLESKLGAVLWVDTEGMVDIDVPGAPVCYEATPVLKCTLEEKTDSSGWNMSREHERFELANGDVVKLDSICPTEELKSCVTVTLKRVTGLWAGIYECGFTIGSVRHTARSQLRVALLPDDIILRISPLTVDCSQEQGSKTLEITATILKSKEPFKVWCDYEKKCDLRSNTTDKDHQVYTFRTSVSCVKTTKSHSATVTFKNTKDQEKTAKVEIPVIYDGTTYCLEEVLNGELWPKTPSDDTVINRTCPEGRTGYNSRTCEGTTWQPVFSHCVNEELNKNLNAAENFLKGLGATREVAKNIFEHLKNTSTSSVTSSEYSTADISTSINIVETMAKASRSIVLHEEVLDDFVFSASNMLNTTWGGINESVSYNMSADYLQSVESLVKNIRINTSTGFSSENLDLKFCRSSDCNVSVFDINVNLNNNSGGLLKTLAVKNLMDRLRNNFDDTERTSLILSATLENRNESSLEIGLNFPRQLHNLSKSICVYWNTSGKIWSREGCKAKTTDDDRILCECTHLTSFSVLMAKGDVSNEVLDIITHVGLGVSICSLIIFLVIESLVWSAVVKTNLSQYRHTALVNIAVFLLLADCCFLASSSPKDLSETMCLTLTVCKHLFFLAMFSWMLCMSVMLVHRLIFVFSPLRKRVFMFLSSIVGYICPILIVGSSYVYCKYTDTHYFKPETCWLVYDSVLVGSIHAFIIPVGTVILTNLFSMVVVIVTLVKSSEGSKTDDKETIKSILKVVVFLTPVFGVTWIIGFAMLMLDQEDPLHDVANYSFTILNSFQGFFLLITGCFAEQKVREELLKIVMKKSKGKSESMKNFTTATYSN